MQDRTRAVRTASRRLMAEIISPSCHRSRMVRIFRHSGSRRGAIAMVVDLSCRARCVAGVVGARVAEIAFSSRRRGLFSSTSSTWALGVQLPLSSGHLGAKRSCALARINAHSGVHRRAVLHVAFSSLHGPCARSSRTQRAVIGPSCASSRPARDSQQAFVA